MHELYVTQQILAIATEEAKKQNARKIDRITVVVGEITGILDESVRFYFSAFCENTLASDAELIIKNVTAELFCPICNQNFTRTKDRACPVCGKMGKLTDIGREFYVESIEVDI